jgi:membrane protein
MLFPMLIKTFKTTLLATLAALGRESTWQTVQARFREDRLAMTAGSLTFTTTLALVPFFTLLLAVFTAFPMFAKLQGNLQSWLASSLVPDSIARQVMGYMTLFAAKANKLGTVGFGFVLVTALALMLTIDKTLNAIWRVKQPRPLAQRVLVYWAAMTLGPLLLGASLAITSTVIAASSAAAGSVGVMTGSLKSLLSGVEFALLALGITALYHYVPHTAVRWRHAAVGGVFVAAALTMAQKGLAFYLGNVPTYSMIYGAFATLPILLLWIYLAWTIVLLGAVIAANLPGLMRGLSNGIKHGEWRRGGGPGWQFQLALEALWQLANARGTPTKGLDVDALAQALRVDSLQLEPVVDSLLALDWVGRINEADPAASAPRLVLLIDPANTPLAPLVHGLLLSPADEGQWRQTALAAGLHGLMHATLYDFSRRRIGSLV